MSVRSVSRSVTIAVAIAGAAALMATSAIAQDPAGEVNRSATIIDNRDIPVIGRFLPRGDGWHIVDGPGDVVFPTGIGVPEPDPRSDADEVWTTVVTMNRKMRKAIDRAYGPRRKDAWRGRDARTKNGQRILATVVRPVEPLDCRTPVNAQLWTTFDGSDPVPYSPNRFADIFAGGSSNTISGAFAASSGSSLSTGGNDLRGLEPGQGPAFFGASARDIGGCDAKTGSLVNFSRVPGRATSVRLAMGGDKDDAFTFDFVGAPDDHSPIALGSPRRLPPFTCVQWRVVSDRSTPGQRVLELGAVGVEPDAAADPLDVPAAVDDEAAPGDEDVVAAALRTLGMPTERQTLGRLATDATVLGFALGGRVMLDEGRLSIALPRLGGSDAGSGGESATDPATIEAADVGTISGDPRCATVRLRDADSGLDTDLCGTIDTGRLLAGLLLRAGDVATEGPAGLDRSRVCDLHLDGGAVPTVSVELDGRLYAAFTALDEAPMAGCTERKRAASGQEALLECGDGEHIRIRQAVPVTQLIVGGQVAELGGAFETLLTTRVDAPSDPLLERLLADDGALLLDPALGRGITESAYLWAGG